MGEEKKEGGGDVSEEKNKEKEQEDEPIVLKVDMHCEACAKKVVKSVKGFQGVEDVAVDRKVNTLVVKGKTADPIKLCERIHSKTGRKVQLISPLPKPKPPEEQPKDEKSKDQKDEQTKDQPPPVVTVMLRAQMHCEACAQLLRKRIRKVKGVESVETDVGKGQVMVKGIIPDPATLAKYVYKSTRKQVSIINDEVEKKEDNNEDNKKEEEDKKEEKKDSEEGVKVEEDDKMMTGGEVNRYEYYWPTTTRYNSYMEHHNNVNYDPQFFSDENPNACSII